MTGPTKGNARRQPGEAAKRNAKQAQYSPYSTATEAQMHRILELLRVRPQTSYDLIRAGIYRPPSRIHDLRERGHHIETTRVTLTDRDGFQHRNCARYKLISEASEQDSLTAEERSI